MLINSDFIPHMVVIFSSRNWSLYLLAFLFSYYVEGSNAIFFNICPHLSYLTIIRIYTEVNLTMPNKLLRKQEWISSVFSSCQPLLKDLFSPFLKALAWINKWKDSHWSWLVGAGKLRLGSNIVFNTCVCHILG